MKKIMALALTAAMIIAHTSAAFAASVDKYVLNVNRTQNIVTVYENNGNGEYSSIKAFVCSVGEDTPSGTFTTSDKYKWRLLFGDVYGQYATRITGHILFHSVPYYTENKNDLEYEEYNKLGETASMGCIRLSVEDAKWIYDNCASGTTVKIYKSDEAEPIAKPIAMKIDASDVLKRGWDPTDPDVNNPWSLADYGDDNIQESEDENTTKTVNVYINGKELSLEAYIAEDEVSYFNINDVAYAFAEAGENISFKDSGNIVYIKNTDQIYMEKSSKKQFIVAVKGSVPVVFGSKCSQLNTYSIDGNVYFSIVEVASLVGLTNAYNINQILIYSK